MSRTLRPTVRAWCCLLLAAAACTGDDRFVSVGEGMRKPGSPLVDAAVSDAEAGGGGNQSGDVPDGSVRLADGAVVPIDSLSGDDGGQDDPNEFDPGRCRVAQDLQHDIEIDFSTETPFTLAPSLTDAVGFGVAYRQKSDCAFRLDAAFIQSAGPFAASHTLIEDCKPTTDVTLVPTDDGFVVAWVDNFYGRSEISSLALTGLMRPRKGEKRVRVTDSALLESKIAGARIGGQAFLAWTAEDTVKGDHGLWIARADGTGTPTELVPASEGRRPMRVAAAELGHSGDSVTTGVVAWLEQVADKGMWIQKVDLDGKPRGSPVKVSQLAGAGSSIDVATRDGDGGALVYATVLQGVTQEVRFRRIDEEGALASLERKIVSLPLQGSDPSLARIGGGYVVAYRARPVAGSDITVPQIRVTFVSKEGNPQLDSRGRLISYFVADAASDGGRTTVRLSSDGQLLIAYVDGGSPDRLRFVRRRLDCP